MTLRLNVARAVTPRGVRSDVSIVIEDGRIVAIENAREIESPLWAVPGFVDIHCHGAVGVSFGDPDPAANLRAIAHHRRHGSTTLVASTVTRTLDDLAAEIGALRPLVEAGELAGIHLEGPFLSAARKGAHDEQLLRSPEPAAVRRLLEAGGGAVKMVTLAVELEGAREAAHQFSEAGCAVAFGHSDADEEITRASLEWGVTVATHLFSAMRSIHHREPGPVPVLLADDRVTCELICDGIHHRPVIARMAIDAAGPHRIALVTDAMSATGSGDGRYLLGDLDVEVADATARLVTPEGRPGAIAGSTLTMDKAFEFIVQEVGCTIEQAAIMAATTPAAALGLEGVGTLAVGNHADICLVDDDGRLHRVLRRGDTVS